MPTYDMKCGKCGFKDEYRLANPQDFVPCPACGTKLEKMVSLFNIGHSSSSQPKEGYGIPASEIAGIIPIYSEISLLKGQVRTFFRIFKRDPARN
jgi:putative FmdB family regulatory protein